MGGVVGAMRKKAALRGGPRKVIECQQNRLYRQESIHLRCRSFIARSHAARSGPLRFLQTRPSCLWSELQSWTHALCPPSPCRRFIPGIRGVEFPGFPGFPTEGGGPPTPRPRPLPCGAPATTAENTLRLRSTAPTTLNKGILELITLPPVFDYRPFRAR